MAAFIYDQSFEGLLTAIFEAFRLKMIPEALLGPGDPLSLLTLSVNEIVTDKEKAGRVWAGLEKKLSPLTLRQIIFAWLTEEQASAELALRYVRAVFSGINECDFGHPDILGMRRTARKVSGEKERLKQFLRFQKTAGDVFFAAVSPSYNVLPLTLSHFAQRFADQKWLIYDLRRNFGFFYNLEKIHEVNTVPPIDEKSGCLASEYLSEDELLTQAAWRKYFYSASIVERANPRLQRQFMPKRFWPYLTEMRAEGKLL